MGIKCTQCDKEAEVLVFDWKSQDPPALNTFFVKNGAHPQCAECAESWKAMNGMRVVSMQEPWAKGWLAAMALIDGFRNLKYDPERTEQVGG